MNPDPEPVSESVAEPVAVGHALTDEERGESTSPRRRMIAFIGIAAVFAAAVVAIAAASDHLSGEDEASPRAVATTTTTQAPLAEQAVPPPEDVEQADLVDAEDARISRAVARGTTTRGGVTTFVLDRRDTGTYGVDDLLSMGAASRRGDVVTLRHPVVVRSGAALRIHVPGGTLRLSGATSIVAWGGSLTLSGSTKEPLTVVGWDRGTKAVDNTLSDGRGYVRTHSGRLAAHHVSFEHLGFWSGRTGGVAATGTSFDPGRVQITDSTIESTHLGLYLSSTKNAVVRDTRISGADQFGVELDRSRGTQLVDVTVDGSGASGVRVHDQSNDLRLMGGSVSANRGYGLVVDGRPRAVGPNTSGYTVVNGSGLAADGTSISGNELGGISISGTSEVSLARLTIDQDRRPLRLVGASTSTTLRDSVLTSRRGPVVEVVGGAAGVSLTGNTMTGSSSGIRVEDSDVDVSGNTIGVGKGSAVSVLGRRTSGRVDDNTFTGSGPDAVTPDDQQLMLVGANDSQQWDTTHPIVDWIEQNPFAPLWLAILVIPAIGLNFIVRRFRMHRDLRQLTEETVIAMTLARRGAKATTSPPSAPTPPVVALEALAVEGPPPEVDTPETRRIGRLVTRGVMGQFASAEDLAVHAVLEAGKSPEQVARTLQVPVSVVVSWIRAAMAVSD